MTDTKITGNLILDGFEEADLRHRKLLEILQIQNTDKPPNELLLDLSSILSELIPHDRLSVGLFLANTWYVSENGAVAQPIAAPPIVYRISPSIAHQSQIWYGR